MFLACFKIIFFNRLYQRNFANLERAKKRRWRSLARYCLTEPSPDTKLKTCVFQDTFHILIYGGPIKYLTL